MRLAKWITVFAAMLLILGLASFFRNESPPRRGETALMIAARQGDTKLVRSLLERGADAHAITPAGKNAMDYAAIGGVCQIETLLALKEKAPDLQFHEPSPLWRNVEVAKLKTCVVLSRMSHLW
jgi:hypothetical protein